LKELVSNLIGRDWEAEEHSLVSRSSFLSAAASTCSKEI
jgi:hypothetical protein